MKVFIALSTLLAVASAAPAQHSHQSIQRWPCYSHCWTYCTWRSCRCPFCCCPHPPCWFPWSPCSPPVHHAPHHLAHGVHHGLAHHAPHHAVHHGLAHHAPHHAIAPVSTMPPFSPMPLS